MLAGAPAAQALPRVAPAAARHGVSVLAADRLAALGLPVPDALAHDARLQLARGQKHRRFTLAAIDALLAAGVTPTLLKGYGLAMRLYPEQPLARPASDVDVLVDRSELDAVATALSPLGLTRHDDPGLADVFEEHHHLSFGGPAGLVEAHFRLMAGFDDLGVRSHLRDWRLDGRPVRLLDEEDEFLYLAAHAANHAFLRASWLVDLQRALTRADAFHWPRMADLSRRGGFFTAVGTALELTERLLHAPIPPAARDAFALSPLRRVVDRRLFSAALVESAALADHRLGGFLMRLWLVDSPWRGARHLWSGARRYVRRGLAER